MTERYWHEISDTVYPIFLFLKAEAFFTSSATEVSPEESVKYPTDNPVSHTSASPVPFPA